MSLPKEPRQLMINIMYLVLTAMLALNVSAEIFNAFAMVDDGLKASNASLDLANEKLPEAIRTGAKKTKALAKYADRIDDVRTTSKEFVDYVEGIKEHLVEMGGGMMKDVTGKQTYKGLKNYDITTRYLTGPNHNDGEGEVLKGKIEAIKAKFLTFIDEKDQGSFASKIPFSIDDESWKNNKGNKKASWSDYNFGHMPLGSVMPILTKFQNDAKSSEAAVLNYLNGKVGGEELVLDKFKVVSAPKKTYIIKGEKFETDVFLSAFASASSNTGINISVNGQKMRLDKDGIATFTATPNSTGKKTYTAKASVHNPATGKTDTYKSSFEYEVGERSVAISASKMNVLYIGVDNPIEISAAGVNSNNIKVNISGGGGNIKRKGDGTYNVRVTQPTPKGSDAKISVTAGKMNVSKPFRVKRIPDPIPKLGKKRGGKMSAGEMKIQPGVFPVLEGFDFEARCNISGFRVVRVAKRSDPIIKVNRGGKFVPEVRSVLAKAKPGDKFYFEDIKCKCPGDNTNRPLGTMSFTIK